MNAGPDTASVFDGRGGANTPAPFGILDIFEQGRPRRPARSTPGRREYTTRRRIRARAPHSMQTRDVIEAERTHRDPPPASGPRERRWSEDDDPMPPARRRPRRSRRPASLAAEADASAPRPAPKDAPEGLVVALGRRWCDVWPGGVRTDEPVRCHLPAWLAGAQRSALAVGDVVLYTEADAHTPPTVAEVRERRSSLARPDPRDPRRKRVVAANIDAAVIVVSVRSPPLHPRLIDRYLVAIQRGGAEPIIAVNKADLLDDDALAEVGAILDPYRRAGVPVEICAAAPEDGAGARTAGLRDLVRGRTFAFVGHSGVGKTSIANALDPALDLKTGAVRRQDRRGRHTTTASSLHELDDGTRLIDTPGVRTFGLHEVTIEELREAFPEFESIGEGCRFRDCTHSHEPGCAVTAAARNGTIAPERHVTYLRLLEEVRAGPEALRADNHRIRPLRPSEIEDPED